jgi:hypothetical protein
MEDNQDTIKPSSKGGARKRQRSGDMRQQPSVVPVPAALKLHEQRHQAEGAWQHEAPAAAWLGHGEPLHQHQQQQKLHSHLGHTAADDGRILLLFDLNGVRRGL